MIIEFKLNLIWSPAWSQEHGVRHLGLRVAPNSQNFERELRSMRRPRPARVNLGLCEPECDTWPHFGRRLGSLGKGLGSLGRGLGGLGMSLGGLTVVCFVGV